MLQKIDKDRLGKVLAIIQNSEMKFPTVTIAKETGYGKSDVSVYLNGKKPMSSKFYQTFIEKFDKQKSNAIPETIDGTPLEKLINHNGNLIDAHKEVAIANRATAEANKLSASTTNELAFTNKELAATNRELTIMLKNSINSNGQNNHQNLAEKVLHRIAEKGVPELWPTKQEGLDKLNKYLIGAPPDITESNKQQKAGKSSIS
jgi:hypothetical protein